MRMNKSYLAFHIEPVDVYVSGAGQKCLRECESVCGMGFMYMARVKAIFRSAYVGRTCVKLHDGYGACCVVIVLSHQRVVARIKCWPRAKFNLTSIIARVSLMWMCVCCLYIIRKWRAFNGFCEMEINWSNGDRVWINVYLHIWRDNIIWVNAMKSIYYYIS